MAIDRRSFVATTAAALAGAATGHPASRTSPPGGSSDPLGVRADFPITAERTYLNSAYIAPIPTPVVQAGTEFLENKSRRPLEVGELLGADGKLRAQFAQLVNASPDEVGLLFSTAEGENIIAQGMDLKAGDNVVVDELHYPTEFVLYRALERSLGIELRIAKHRDGVVDASDFAPLVDQRTKIVSVAWVSHQNGFRHDMRPIADLAHAHGAVFYADAIQAVGMVSIDVQAAGVDAICAGSYKWMLAGFGVAPFYIKRDLIDRLRIDRYGEFQVEKELPDHHFELGKTARKFDYCSRAFGPVRELSAALTYLQNVGVARIEEHTVGLAHRLYDGLSKQGHRLFTPPGNRSSIVTMLIAKPMGEVRSAFQGAKVDVTVRDGQIRIAPALFNTEEEIDRCLEVTKAL
ncbi:MAG TPA: aminotransferase class V-fold PLP-dependent enzyme [Gemmatimonadales bacterium]|jgi:selenocysteine lyase/cysteine desulfurase|nr:aminotransferase class V-fold PLP-dependent enzyme [Gemmatimonadales bacterium]